MLSFKTTGKAVCNPMTHSRQRACYVGFTAWPMERIHVEGVIVFITHSGLLPHPEGEVSAPIQSVGHFQAVTVGCKRSDGGVRLLHRLGMTLREACESTCPRTRIRPSTSSWRFRADIPPHGTLFYIRDVETFQFRRELIARSPFHAPHHLPGRAWRSARRCARVLYMGNERDTVSKPAFFWFAG